MTGATMGPGAPFRWSGAPIQTMMMGTLTQGIGIRRLAGAWDMMMWTLKYNVTDVGGGCGNRTVLGHHVLSEGGHGGGPTVKIAGGTGSIGTGASGTGSTGNGAFQIARQYCALYIPYVSVTSQGMGGLL